MSRTASNLFCLVCALASLLAFSSLAAAAFRPHSSRGTAQFISDTEFVGSGNATHLGRYSETGTVLFTPTEDPAVLQVDGSIVYTAANGDERHATVSGQLNGQTGVITATLTYVGGTGRFDDATGSATLAGQAGPGGTISVRVSGNIDY